MNTPNDGGPAFPGDDGWTDRGTHYHGMSLRDWFAGNAPETPQSWFEPTVLPAPESDPNWQWCEGCKADSDCEGNADCQKIKTQMRAFGAWKANREKQRWIQWPYAWADAMLAARNKEQP